jgi:predicted nuclease with TOPRIM domain
VRDQFRKRLEEFFNQRLARKTQKIEAKLTNLNEYLSFVTGELEHLRQKGEHALLCKQQAKVGDLQNLVATLEQKVEKTRTHDFVKKEDLQFQFKPELIRPALLDLVDKLVYVKLGKSKKNCTDEPRLNLVLNKTHENLNTFKVATKSPSQHNSFDFAETLKSKLQSSA